MDPTPRTENRNNKVQKSSESEFPKQIADIIKEKNLDLKNVLIGRDDQTSYQLSFKSGAFCGERVLVVSEETQVEKVKVLNQYFFKDKRLVSVEVSGQESNDSSPAFARDDYFQKKLDSLTYKIKTGAASNESSRYPAVEENNDNPCHVS